MVSPLGGALPVSLAAATTEVGDVDGGPPVGALAACPAAATTKVGDIDGGAPRGAGSMSGSGHHHRS
jgi:hypothetical protein